MMVFNCETAEVRVSPMMEALGDQPWRVQIVPNSPLLPVESLVVEEETYPFIAAQEGLDRYKEKHGLPMSEAWAL